MTTLPDGTRRGARAFRFALPLAGALLVACSGAAVVDAGDGHDQGASTLEPGDVPADAGTSIGAAKIVDAGNPGDAPTESSVTRSPTGSTIVPESSLRCLEVTGGGAIVQTTCDGGSAQRFELVATGEAFVVRTSLGTCLDYGATPGSAAPVFATTCLAPPSNQVWTVTAHTDGSYSFAAASGKGCLGPESSSSADLAAMITWTCQGDAPSERMYMAELAARPPVAPRGDGGAT